MTAKPLDTDDLDAFRHLFAELGELQALDACRLSKVGAYRALAGLPVRAGTAVLIRDAIRAARARAESREGAA